MGKGSNTTTTNQSQTYTPSGAGYMTNALNQAGQAAQLPFNIPQAPVAGFSNMQNQGFNAVSGAQGSAQPYYDQANSYFSPQGASQFFNPMASNVMAQMQNIFGQQNAQNTGNLVQSAGGVGADRIGVGQANMANQQGLAAGQTLAQLWQQAQQASQGAGQGQMALGQNVFGTNMQGANALLNAGGLQQQQQQAQLNAPYQQQLAQAAFPYQQAQFLAGITGSLAPGLGGTTQGTGTQTSQYNPSTMSQILGGGLALGSIFANRGGAINPFASGGSVDESPIDISHGYIPQLGNMTAAQAHIPQLNLNMSAPNMGQQGQGNLAGSLGSLMSGYNSGKSNLFGMSDASQDWLQDTLGLARGGMVRNPFADGGDVFGAGEVDDPLRAQGRDLLRDAMINKYGVNANDPIHEPDPAAVNAWRDGADADAPDAMALAAPAGAGPAPTRSMAAPAQAVAPPSPAAGYAAPPAAQAAPDGGGSSFGNALRNWAKGPGPILLQAGLGAWTPGGISGGLAAGLKTFQGQESADQAAAKLQQEAQQHLDEMNTGTFAQRGALDIARQKLAKDEGDTTVKDIIQGMKDGTIPPSTTGLYSKGAAVRAEAARQGFNLTKAGLEYATAQKQVQVLNGPQTMRLVGLAKSVDNTIDEVTQLSEQLHNSGVPILNRAKLAAIMQTEGNSPRGQLATRYLTAVNTVKEEFANAANGGYAPTEPAWQLANQQINGDYGEQQLKASLSEVQRLIRYRINAIPNMGTLGPGAQNRYTGQTGQSAGPQGGGAAAPSFTGRTASGPGGAKLRETSDGQWVQ